MDFINKLPTKEYNCGITSIEFPGKNNFDDFQEGFRDDGVTKDCYISTKKGYWQPSWYVIAIDTMMGDPYFIDINDNKIYFVEHDGDWGKDVISIASNLDSFIKIMEVIDNNLSEVNEDDYEQEEIKELANKTIEEIKKLDSFINVNHFKTIFYTSLGID